MLTRRRFNAMAAQLGAVVAVAPGLSLAGSRPKLSTGISSGDVCEQGAVIWTRTDRPSRLWVDVASDPGFSQFKRHRGGAALQQQDFNARALISGLEPGRNWFYRASFESLETPGVFGNTLSGHFQTAPAATTEIEDVRFCWSGDTAGQGYGIDLRHGGMQTYAAMLSHKPQFLVHSGDQIYADGPLSETLTLDDGSLWRNQLTEAKTRVAQSTQDFRENYYYNFLDPQLRQFHAQVPVYVQWDDHEVVNNWYPGQQLNDDDRYQVKSASLLAARSRQALFDCNPLRRSGSDPEQLYRQVSYGPLLDLFFLDMRSYRGPNSVNRQSNPSAETAFLGRRQLDWLKRSLSGSTATWKIICADMPLGIIVRDWGTEIAENATNGDGPPLGREFEIAELLSFLQRESVSNVHFITADVHYCASNHYRPDQAVFKDFDPFWEFVSGPLHAGTFPPGDLDNTFGPERVFCGVPKDLPANRPPSAGYQFFGKIEIDAVSREMTVGHYNRDNQRLWQMTLPPVMPG